VSREKILIQQVGHTYTPPTGAPVRALENVSLEVGENEFVALVGPSGCGKSTLLYMVGGFLPLREGRILVDGRSVEGPGPDRGIVFQHFALFPWKTVRQNVLYGLEKQGMEPARRREVAQRFLDMVKLSGFEDVYPSQLSGGMKQRVALARALVMDPSILLLDEPFEGLAPVVVNRFIEAVQRIKEEMGVSLLIAESNLATASRVADRLYAIDRGEIIFEGDPRTAQGNAEVMKTLRG